MVRHNNMIPHGHFHKKWQPRVKTWFDQPAKKAKRNKLRTRKALAMAPRPRKWLRPIVRCPTVRYHIKVREGRGFTLQELKAAGLNRRYARSIGICVEYRRRNESYESLKQNVLRLKNYVAKLVILSGKSKVDLPCAQVDVNKVLPIPSRAVATQKARFVTESEANDNVYVTLRKARREGKKLSRSNKRKNKTDILDVDKK